MRYATDHEYRLRQLEKSKAHRDKERIRYRERYTTDPEYRARKLSQARKYKFGKPFSAARALVAANTLTPHQPPTKGV